MRNPFVKSIRIIAVFFLFFGLLEYFIDSGDKPAIIKYPIIWLVLAVFLMLVLSIEYIVSALDNIAYQSMSTEKRAEYDTIRALPWRERPWYKDLMQKLTRSAPIEDESLVMLKHEYDGIRELDNNLPPWWLYLFYGGIIFAAVYLVRYEVLGADDQETELRKELAQAKIDVEEYMKNAPDLMDEKSVTQLTDAPSLEKGKAIYEMNCAACHRADGGGQIGPNLVDQYWIFGGDIKNIFHTIANGGRDGKGMVAWKGTLKPTEMQLAASYILSLQGTNPKDAKTPDGDLWEPAGSAPAAPATIK